MHLGLSSISFPVTIFIIGFVFYLIFFLYQRVRERLNPRNVLKISYRKANKGLSEIYRIANRIAEFHLNNPQTDTKITKEEALAAAFIPLIPRISDTLIYINYLFDYHDKLLSSSEKSSAIEVLNYITKIFSDYFSLRKDSSIVLPVVDTFLATTSDSGKLLTTPLERLKATGENYMRLKDRDGITQTINVFYVLIVEASKVGYISAYKVENPILEQCRGYLDMLIKEAIVIGDEEALFQGAIKYGKIYELAVKNHLFHEYGPIFETLDKIALKSLSKQQDVVFSQVMSTYSDMITVLVNSESDHYFKLYIKDLLKQVDTNLLRGYSLMTLRSLDNISYVQINLVKPYSNTSALIIQIRDFVIKLYEKKEENSKKIDHWKSRLLSLAENLRRSLITVSNSIKNADSIIISDFSECIYKTSTVLIDLTLDKNWQDDREELIRQIAWYVYQPKNFTTGVDKIKNNSYFNSLVEATAKIGIKAVQADLDEIAIDAVNAISDIAIDMLTKEMGTRYGSTEPRIMLRACYIGILALKLDRKELFARVKELVIVFDEQYKSIWFKDSNSEKVTSPNKRQLEFEVADLIDNIKPYQRDLAFMDTSEELIISLVKREDVEKFIEKVWSIKFEKRRSLI